MCCPQSIEPEVRHYLWFDQLRTTHPHPRPELRGCGRHWIRGCRGFVRLRHLSSHVHHGPRFEVVSGPCHPLWPAHNRCKSRDDSHALRLQPPVPAARSAATSRGTNVSKVGPPRPPPLSSRATGGRARPTSGCSSALTWTAGAWAEQTATCARRGTTRSIPTARRASRARRMERAGTRA